MKPAIHKKACRWEVVCPCGFTWTTRFHRLAVLFAIEHAHQIEVSI